LSGKFLTDEAKDQQGNLFEAPQKISGAAISLKRRMPAAARRGEKLAFAW